MEPFNAYIPHLKVKLLSATARLPTRGTEGAIGLDLSADLPVNTVRVVDPGKRILVATGIVVAIPEGYYGRVAPRSGLALKHGIDVLGGVCDSDYRGEVFVLLQNLNQWNSFHVKSGDRIAQLILERADILPI